MSDSMVVVLAILVAVGACAFVALILAVFAGSVFLIFRGGRAQGNTWAEVASRMGLTFKPGGLFTTPVVDGEYRGRRLHANIYTSGMSRHERIYTAATVTLKGPVDWNMQLSLRSGPADSLTSGASQDVQIGNPQFDERFSIRSDQPERAQRLLGRAGTQALIMALPHVLSLELQGQVLTYRQRGGGEDAEVLVRILTTLSDLADVIES
jgi:hypothetical protein